MKKAILFVLMFFFVVGCTNGSGKKVTIKPTLDKRLKEMQLLPLHAGLFIEPSLRCFSQEEWQTSRLVGIHHYGFPIGDLWLKI